MSVSEILLAVAERIRANPEGYDQSAYARKVDCGTAFCIAGHICIVDGLICRKDLNAVSGYTLLRFFTPDGKRVLPETHASALLMSCGDFGKFEVFKMFRNGWLPPSLRSEPRELTNRETADAVADYLIALSEFI